MKILVTGSTGQLGYDVVNEGIGNGFEMYGVGSKDLDITKENEVNNYIEKLEPDAIIHCAAYTAVDNAEDNKEACWQINVEGTKNLAEVAKKLNIRFLYISTDYVFNGEGNTPFNETDETAPINYYGLTKYEGEKIVQEITKSFIVRISWVFGINGSNFVRTMLRLAESKTELNVVGDQIGSPTYTHDLAKLLIEMIQSEKYGIYHATNDGFCSWAEFAKEIFNQSDKEVRVNSIPTEDFPTKAERPKNSRLSKSKLSQNGFTLLPRWQDSLRHYLNKL
ncbi:dTDP-4-dehydrorhamnose reductase [Virgibacillus halodenitrificans]|uniref:dTDP-4-dehydrorhamnose reductase n=1 Tax=Virgibacillus halodenitrificans TaxID=1482 RepID=A0ABR7VKM9_VIRHA|nr:dTDP-4-dehydrorhamnose reductase [Virgibacillus halodenitrificans]MBD1221402.1 dTDP-4-dehydrorhamnose reductase [Virgibacillus halodenitrificans]